MGEHIRAAAAGVRAAVALALRRRAPPPTAQTRSFGGVPLRSGAAPASFGMAGSGGGGDGHARCCVGEQPRAMFPESSSPWPGGIGGFAARGVASSSSSAAGGRGGEGGGGEDSSSTSTTLAAPSSTSASAAASGGEGEGEDAEAAVAAAAAKDKANARKDLYMMFTCGRCDTRAAKGFSRQAYENGVVIVRCPGCESQHLVADRYGWFGEPGSVEDFLADQTVVKGTAKTGSGEGGAGATGAAGAAAAVGGGMEDEEGTLEIDEEQLQAWLAKGLRKKSSEDGGGGGGEK